MDVLAVEQVVGDAVARARQGRPMLVEALIRRAVDPVAALAAQLEREGAMDADARAAFEAEVARRLDRAVAFAQASPEPRPSELYDGAAATP
jgi:pyruvate dehydrogenase E1 component alpha subunit